ncbi:MAG: hypothetical protein ACREMY_27125, partial [bacterium]
MPHNLFIEMRLTEAFVALALRLQEQATDLSQNDIRARLADALSDYARDQQCYCYCVDIFGDDQSGDVVYLEGGDTKRAPYEFSTVNGKQVVAINFDQAVDVMPRTVYEEEADEADHYASMAESFVKAKLYTELPLYERFISKDERAAADDSDFAGKGKSFPILKPGDVDAAVKSMGRAGSSNYDTATLKGRIIRIAKRKGWTKYLPKSWQGGDDSSTSSGKEARTRNTANKAGNTMSAAASTINLTESAATLETIVLKEARSDYEIKLISPGEGSSAFYPAEVLKRDGPKVFTKETHVYLNHPTKTEEAERPENDVRNLAGVLTTDAVYHEAHAKGPG